MVDKASSQRHFLVAVSGIPGLFDTKTGGETSAEATKHYNGGSNKPEILSGPAETENVVVSRSWKRDRDAGPHRAARKNVGKWYTTLSITPTDADFVAFSEPTVYADALLVRVSEPDYDSSSSDPATFELEFAVGNAS